jgi:hypothetical protein
MKRKGFSLKLTLYSTMGCAIAMAPSPAQAAFHLWNIRELYSDSSGNLQFIELFDTSGFQNFVGGQQVSVTSGGSTHVFTIPGGSLPGNTLNHALLIGTSGIQGAGGPMPDYIMPSGFLFTGGASITFFGANSGPYSALPTDGAHSRVFGTLTDALDSPQNFAGQIGAINVPEPSTVGLLALGGAGILVGLLRRKGR